MAATASEAPHAAGGLGVIDWVRAFQHGLAGPQRVVHVAAFLRSRDPR